MKTLTAALCLLALPATAQGYDVEISDGQSVVNARVMTFTQIDVNRDNILSPQEIRAAFGKDAREAVMTFDGNGDGWFTRNEVLHYGDLDTGGPAGSLWEYPWE